ncbi:MAG: hypothetical protein Q4C96_08915 [Planctomycetia bacterium]|nr:hypothetical protein [Planctomycetia bacterium]
MTKKGSLCALLVILGFFLLCNFTHAEDNANMRLPGGYAVVVSEETAENAEWKPVLEKLVSKYDAQVIRYTQKLEEVLPSLQEKRPRYVCFLAQAKEATGNMVVGAHRISRDIDADLWTDCLWSILTGYNAQDAMKIVEEKPLVIRRVLGGTSLKLECAESGVWYSESKKNEKWVKKPGEKPEPQQGPDDTTKAIIDELVEGKAQLFCTSGHATERDWQIGYAYRNGHFRSQPGGKLIGVDSNRQEYEIQSDEPRVHLGIGNCLIGHINNPDNCMALGLMHSAGVRQMVGYIVPTWYGYMGWGMLDYFYLQPGRYTVSEAFFANNQALLYRMDAAFPGMNKKYNEILRTGNQTRTAPVLSEKAKEWNLSVRDLQGLLHDRDTVAIYGDPAWDARMKEGQNEWSQTVTETGEGTNQEFTVTLKKMDCDNSDKNGSQRGGRPLVIFLPNRLSQNEDGSVKNLEVLEGSDLEPVIADDFVLIPRFDMEAEKEYKIRFKAEKK